MGKVKALRMAFGQIPYLCPIQSGGMRVLFLWKGEKLHSKASNVRSTPLNVHSKSLNVHSAALNREILPLQEENTGLSIF